MAKSGCEAFAAIRKWLMNGSEVDRFEAERALRTTIPRDFCACDTVEADVLMRANVLSEEILNWRAARLRPDEVLERVNELETLYRIEYARWQLIRAGMNN